MLATRVLSGIILVAALLGVLLLDEWFAPFFPFWLLFCVAAMVAASIELVGLMGRTAARPSTNAVIGGVLALILANWMPHVTEQLASRQLTHAGSHESAEQIGMLAWPLLSFVGILMLTFLVHSVQFVRPGRTVASIAGTIFAIAYLGLLGSFVIQLRWVHGLHGGIVALAYLVAVAKGSDTGAYTFGRLAGRHKLWPIISPNKTIEGAIGGLACAVLACLLVSEVARRLLGHAPLGTAATIGYGVLVGIAAQLGDLMESMIKRDCERKDASAAVPGFGGVLDVVDSLLFAGPVAYGCWTCWAA